MALFDCENCVNYNSLIPEKFTALECTYKLMRNIAMLLSLLNTFLEVAFDRRLPFKVGLNLLDKKDIKKLNSLIDLSVLFVVR